MLTFLSKNILLSVSDLIGGYILQDLESTTGQSPPEFIANGWTLLCLILHMLHFKHSCKTIPHILSFAHSINYLYELLSFEFHNPFYSFFKISTFSHFRIIPINQSCLVFPPLSAPPLQEFSSQKMHHQFSQMLRKRVPAIMRCYHWSHLLWSFKLPNVDGLISNFQETSPK